MLLIDWSALDSTGRIRPGFFTGSALNSIGDYDQCQLVSSQSFGYNGSFQYCLASIKLLEPSSYLQITYESSSLIQHQARTLTGKLGLCAPSACSELDLTNVLSYSIERFDSFSSLIEVQAVSCPEDSGKNLSTTSEVLGLNLVILMILMSLGACVLATIRDSKRLARNKKNGTTHTGYLSIFSLYRNLPSLISAPEVLMINHHDVKNDNDEYPVSDEKIQSLDLRSIDGIRAISSILILLNHSYSFADELLFFDNLNSSQAKYDTLLSQLVVNGPIMLNNFFFISALLSGLKLLSRKSRQQPLTISMFLKNLLNRYLRLMPLVMIVVIFSVHLMPLFSRGPNSQMAVSLITRGCQNGGWLTNLFLIHNLISPPNLCLGHTWSVGVDFQLFIQNQLILMFISGQHCRILRFHKLLLKVLIVCSQLVVSSVVAYEHLNPLPMLPGSLDEKGLYYIIYIYIKPYTWLASYNLGSLMAIKLLTNEKYSEMIKRSHHESNEGAKSVFSINESLRQFGPIIVLISIQFSSYFYLDKRMSPQETFFYTLLVRPFWCLALYQLMVSNHMMKSINNNHARLNQLNELLCSFLSSPMWIPISKLSFAISILNPIVIASFYSSKGNQTFRFSHCLMLSFGLFNLVVTLTLALLLHLLFELPIKTLLKQLI